MKTLDLREFQASGVLQEANRLFFHPLGLALGIRVDDIAGTAHLFVWDAQDDPEGIVFPPEVIDTPEAVEKAKRVQAMFAAHEAVRCALLGGDAVQAIPGYHT